MLLQPLRTGKQLLLNQVGRIVDIFDADVITFELQSSNGKKVIKRLPYSHEKGCPKADTPETLKESLYCTCKSNWELNHVKN